MARQIEDITVKLGIVGFEELNKLRSSFRELTKVTNATDTQLDDARKRLLELKAELGNTTRVNKGLTDAFGALLDEAKRGSDVWKQLNTDLAKIRQESRLTDTQITALRDIIVDESKAHAQSANSIREHVKSLQDLRNQASLNGKVHQQLGADIQKLTDTLKQGEITNREHYKSLGQILAVKPDAVLRQWQAYTRILQEGTASADKLAAAQRRLNQLSGAPRILERRRVSESAAITQDPEYLRRFGFEGASLPELPNTNAAYAQQIKELQQDLAHLDRTSIEYLQTLMQLAGVQRQSTEVARGYAQALLMGVQTKTVANSTRNLQEVITALRAEMQQLDTTTSEGSAAYATNANQVRNLEQQLKNLAGAYRHVGDMATQAATAEQNAANARIRDNYLNRGMVRQQEAALAELGQRVRQGVSGTPLLLPAAGQTSAPGTGLQYSGQNVRLGRRPMAPDLGLVGQGTERFFGKGELGIAAIPGGTFTAPRFGSEATPEQSDRARRTYIAESDARRANAETIEQQRVRMENLRAAVAKATSANTGSINSLGNLREALANLRNEIPATNSEFKQLTNRLQDVDVRSERLSTRASRRLSGTQLAQGVGAALSGGIFGGPEGLLGGLGGLAVGGVGGAFAGAAFGAQVGMFRQQLAGVTDYSAGIDKLQIALRGIVGSQAAYSQALAAAASVTRDLNIPQETAIQGMTRLSAAVLGAGGKVSDSAFAFRAVSEAVKATGGNAEQADGALLALTQVFSKGKVSAEELNQIAERLPGTFTLFAKAAGKSGPELQKALQQGEVGLNDLMKFLQLISSQYGQTALKIAASSQEAGARLSVAMKNMQLEVGRALQPIGASLQSAFADFITKITPAVVTALKGIAAAFEFLIENKTASGLATFALQLGAVTFGVIAFKAAVSGLASIQILQLLTGTASAVKITGDAAAASALSVRGLSAALAAVPGFGWVAAGTAALGLLGAALYNNNKEFKTWVDSFLYIIKSDFEYAWKIAVDIVQTNVKVITDTWEAAKNILTNTADALVTTFDSTFNGIFSGVLKRWQSLPEPLRKAMAQDGANVAGTLLAPGNPVIGRLIGTGIRATQERPPVALADTGRYVPGNAQQRIPGQLSTFPGGSKEAAEKLATSYLQAFEQREEAIAQARIQHEEQIADIRKQALEQARQLERQFADERRALERDIANSKRGTADIEEDIARQRRLLAGEDPRIIEAEQRIVDVYREARDRDIDIKQQYADREFNRARTLSDFQKKTADDINKANETYAKSLGKIHREYARDVGKILDEGSGKTAKRLEAASKIVALYLQRAALNMNVIEAAGVPVAMPGRKGENTVSAGALLSRPEFKNLERPIRSIIEIDEQLQDAQRRLQSRRQTPSTADRFFTAYADQPQFEDVAGLQPLPITRMQRQAARPLRLRQQRYPERTTVNTTFNSSVLQRIERMQQVVDNWDPIGSQWKEIQNNLREVKRSRPAASVPAAVLADIARRMWSDMLPVVRKAGGLGRDVNGRLGSQVDFSEYLNDKQLRVLKQGLRSTLEPAYTSQFGINKQPEALTRAVGLLAPMFRDFRRALVTLLEQEVAQGRVYAEKTLQKLGVDYTKVSRAPNPDTIEERFNRRFNPPINRLLDQPNIVPGVGKDFEGAMLPSGDFSTDKLTRNLGNVATRQLQGILTQVTNQLIAKTPYRVGDNIGASAQRTRTQPISIVPATKGADKASEDARAAAAANSAAKLQRDLLAISTEALAPLTEQNRRLQEQNDLFQAQQRYIKQGITPALAEQYAQIDQIGEIERRLAARRIGTAVDEALKNGANNETVLQLVRNHRDLTASIDSNVNSAKNLASAYQDAQKAARFIQDNRIGLGLREGAEQYVQSIGTMREATAQLAQTGIKGVEDAIFSLVTTGTANFREFAASILRDTSRMIIQQLILRSVMQIIGAIGGGSGFGKGYFDPITGKGVAGPNFGFAKGGIFGANNIQPFAMGGTFQRGVTAYAMGGIVTKPTLFKFADGGAGRLGLMGEAGPEAIMPLRRLPSGRLGVESAGGGTTNVVVNVDASGSQVQGDSSRGEALGRAVSAAVQAELVRQQRPGGLLAGTRQ